MDNLITCWDDSLAWAGSKSFRLQDKVENRKEGQLSQRPKQKARANKRRQIAVKDIKRGPTEVQNKSFITFHNWLKKARNHEAYFVAESSGDDLLLFCTNLHVAISFFRKQLKSICFPSSPGSEWNKTNFWIQAVWPLPPSHRPHFRGQGSNNPPQPLPAWSIIAQQGAWGLGSCLHLVILTNTNPQIQIQIKTHCLVNNSSTGCMRARQSRADGLYKAIIRQPLKTSRLGPQADNQAPEAARCSHKRTPWVLAHSARWTLIEERRWENGYSG